MSISERKRERKREREKRYRQLKRIEDKNRETEIHSGTESQDNCNVESPLLSSLHCLQNKLKNESQQLKLTDPSNLFSVPSAYVGRFVERLCNCCCNADICRAFCVRQQ